MTEAVYIAAAKRTPVGRLNGALAACSAVDLGIAAARQVLADTSLDPAAVDEAIFGQVLTAGAGQNPARQTAIGAGLPKGATAFTVNKVCGSGLKAIHLATQAIALGDASIILAGGQESMSQAPHLLRIRQAPKAGDMTQIDSIFADGLVDAFHHVPMGITAEHLATRFAIGRDEQDAFALVSHQRAVAAVESTFVDEIVAVSAGREIVARDEQPRPDSSLAALSRLKPAFSPDGSVTAGNSASLNDGAAAVLVAGERTLPRLNLAPLARIVSYASVALEPMDMGLGAANAARAALRKADWRIDDVDVIEINEAFAVQTLAVIAELDCDPIRVNVNGGAVALGHPIGASGARIVVTLLHQMRRAKAQRGLATLCIGGGQGVAICVEAA